MRRNNWCWQECAQGLFSVGIFVEYFFSQWRSGCGQSWHWVPPTPERVGGRPLVSASLSPSSKMKVKLTRARMSKQAKKMEAAHQFHEQVQAIFNVQVFSLMLCTLRWWTTTSHTSPRWSWRGTIWRGSWRRRCTRLGFRTELCFAHQYHEHKFQNQLYVANVCLKQITPAGSAWSCSTVLSTQRWIFLRKTNISSHTPNMALHGNPGPPWYPDSNISARSPKKAIFLHIVAIYLHRPQRKCYFYAQSNKKFTKSALYNIVQCFAYIFMSALCNIFQCFADIFMSVLRLTVPDQYFCTKHLIWIYLHEKTKIIPVPRYRNN